MRDARFRRVSGVRSSPTIKRVRAAPGYRLDFLFLVSRVIITLPGPLFRGTAVTKVTKRRYYAGTADRYSELRARASCTRCRFITPLNKHYAVY